MYIIYGAAGRDFFASTMVLLSSFQIKNSGDGNGWSDSGSEGGSSAFSSDDDDDGSDDDSSGDVPARSPKRRRY